MGVRTMRTIYDKRLLILEEKKREQERKDNELRKINGEDVYIYFCVWCNAFNNSNGKNNIKLFERFLSQENYQVNDYQLKYLKEKYFKGKDNEI
jgi:hypothetical protein